MDQLNGRSELKANEFLHKEYEMCYAQLRFYDNRQTNLMKFLFAITTSSAGGIFAVYKFFGAATKDFHTALCFFAFVVAIGAALLTLSMVQNRLYFVYIARQINSIRGFLLSSEAPDFKGNQLYTSSDFSAIKPFSIHTIQLLGSTILTSGFISVGSYGCAKIASHNNTTCILLTTFFTSLVVMMLVFYFYLSKKGKKSADSAIHGK